MKGIRDKMQKYVGIYKKYQDYLERVISETRRFRSITEIFERYENLIEVKESLSKQQEKNIELLEESEAEIVYYIDFFFFTCLFTFYYSNNFIRYFILFDNIHFFL